MDQFNLKNIISEANDVLNKMNIGKEYTIDYIKERLDAAMNEYPNDPVIRSIAQVISRQANSGKLVTSQKELYEIYNHFAGLSSMSMVKEAMGDLLYPQEINPKATVNNETMYTFRPNSPELDFKIEYNPLENIFDKNANNTSYYDPTLAKLGKHAIIQELTNIGVVPNNIKVVAGVDNTAIVYDVIFTNKLGEAHVPIFVEISNGVQTPTHFYSDNKFTELSAENLNKYIVEKANQKNLESVEAIGGVKTSASIVSSSFVFEEDVPGPITVDKIPLPEPLKDLIAFEDAIIDSSTSFSHELVKAAKAICNQELMSMGFNTQVSLSEATDNCIICSAELNSASGKVEIKLPVDIIDDRPQIPALFYNENDKDKIYDFSSAEIKRFLTSVKPENGQILRYSNDFFNMTFNQLKDEILTGVANKDYIRAEQALNRIEDKFGQEYHRAALFDYAKYLAASSVKEEATPQYKCRLLLSKGSVEPRCGHYNVVISRVITNEKGDCELIDRKAKYENLTQSTGTMIRSNKVTLT